MRPGPRDYLRQGLIKEMELYPPPLDPAVSLAIAQQVELVFSNTALARDSFLLKHVKRNREGYVSLKLLISAYKPIKRLTADWRQVAMAVTSNSTLLSINQEGTKVRRLTEVPSQEEVSPCCNSRTVVATCFSIPSPSIRDVVNIFSDCGEIIQVRVLRPGNPTSGGVRRYLAAHPELQRQVCAFVEFETAEAAGRAVREVADPGGLQVREYLEPGEVKEKKKAKRPSTAHSRLYSLPPPHHPGVIGDRARTVHSKQSEEDEEDAWSVDEGIHVEEDEQGTASVVDNSEWEDLVNKTVDFVFD